MSAFKNFSFFALAALLIIGTEKGNGAAVTLYGVPAPPFQFPTQFQGTITVPLLSESVSVIGPGSNGATLYKVEEIRTAEMVIESTTTFTQAAPTLSTTIPVVFTREQDATHYHEHILPTTIDSGWIMNDQVIDCTMDIAKSTGACNVAFSLSETVVKPGATQPVQTIVTTSVTSWTGVPTPIATVEVSSDSKQLRGSNLAGIFAVLSVYTILQM